MVRQRLADRHRADRQTVAVGRDGSQVFAFGFKQHAVEVITDILMRHGKLRGFDKTLHGRLRQREFHFALPVVQIREIRRWQRGERETATPGTHAHTVAIQLNGDFRAFRQAAADIKEFTGRHGGRARLVRLHQRDARHHFHFQIGAGQRQRAIRDLKQQVAEDRQRRTTAQRAADLLERL